MTCTAISTGHLFLSSVLSNIDCQAQNIGAYGFGALAGPASPIAGVMLALLTLFIGLFGLRLMFGAPVEGSDLVGAALKVGIALTLATSWPAWRTLGYDLVLDGPSELAAAVGGSSGLPGSRGDLDTRLQRADDGIVALTMYGTGRLTGGVVGSSDLGDSARGVALADQQGFAWGRIAFLAGTIGPIAVVRLGAGLLLALAPLMAGLLLFTGTRDLFAGWLRALAACMLGALALSIVYGTELALIESWLTDALTQRQDNVFTPAAPTELTVLTFAFALASLGVLALIVRMSFFASSWSARLTARLHEAGTRAGARDVPTVSRIAASVKTNDAPRGQLVAESIANSVRREERLLAIAGSAPGRDGRHIEPHRPVGPSETLGSSWRRSQQRASAAAARRDGGT